MTAKKNKAELARMTTGIANLDTILRGGLPGHTVCVIGGTPGSGKTTLSQQICFKNATPERPALIFSTLSEPMAKTLRYISQFDYFDPVKLENGSIRYIDLGSILRSEGLEQAFSLFLESLREIKPGIVVVDSFKAFGDLARSNEELRKFSYEIAIHLMAWECCAFLIGEYSAEELSGDPLSSIVDGIIMLVAREQSGEQQRFIQTIKMRGTDHDRDAHPFSISSAGLEVYTPRLTIRRETISDRKNGVTERVKTGISTIDQHLSEGIPVGSSILVSGNSGSGKTLLCLEALYRGAKEFNEKGLFFTFEETPERLLATAEGMGWQLRDEIKRGMFEFVYVPHPDILIEKHLFMIQSKIESFAPRRIGLDSVSLYLSKISDPNVARDKMFQLATLVQRAHAIGFFSSEAPLGHSQSNPFWVVEAMVDGIIRLSSSESAKHQTRHLEVIKLRNTAHSTGLHAMTIAKGGITVEA